LTHTGFAFGTGSAIARKAVDAAVDSMSGSATPAAPSSVDVPKQQPAIKLSGICEPDQAAFVQCLQSNAGDVGKCDFYFTALQQCQANGQANTKY